MSTYIDRIMQRSSATEPTFGQSSLKSMPLWPYFLNLNGDFIKLPTRKKLTGVEPGVGSPSYLSTIGLGSNESMCDTPPFIKRKMTCLARGLKCSLPVKTPGTPVCASEAV